MTRENEASISDTSLGFQFAKIVHHSDPIYTNYSSASSSSQSPPKNNPSILINENTETQIKLKTIKVVNNSFKNENFIETTKKLGNGISTRKSNRKFSEYNPGSRDLYSVYKKSRNNSLSDINSFLKTEDSFISPPIPSRNSNKPHSSNKINKKLFLKRKLIKKTYSSKPRNIAANSSTPSYNLRKRSPGLTERIRNSTKLILDFENYKPNTKIKFLDGSKLEDPFGLDNRLSSSKTPSLIKNSQTKNGSPSSSSDSDNDTKLTFNPLPINLSPKGSKIQSAIDGSSLGNISFDSVGGLKDHIRLIKEIVILPLLYPEICARFSLRPPRGLLFHGPPGTGKTLLAKALANSCSTETQKVAFYLVKSSECLSKFIGEGERNLRLLFERAAETQPSIIFFDEIDGLAPIRNSKHDQSHTSIVTTLLALMDGLEDRGQVIVIGATNRPDSVDPAFRRPGRFDRELFFGNPDREARSHIFAIHTKSWPHPLSQKMLDYSLDRSSGWSGADIGSFVNEIALCAIRRSFPNLHDSHEKLQVDTNKINILDCDVVDAMDKLHPFSVTSADSLGILDPLLGDVCRNVSSIYIDSKNVKNFANARAFVHGALGMGQEVLRLSVVARLAESKITAFSLNPSSLLTTDQSAESLISSSFANAIKNSGVIVISGLLDWVYSEWVVVLNQLISESVGQNNFGLLVISQDPAPSWASHLISFSSNHTFELGNFDPIIYRNFFSPLIAPAKAAYSKSIKAESPYFSQSPLEVDNSLYFSDQTFSQSSDTANYIQMDPISTKFSNSDTSFQPRLNYSYLQYSDPQPSQNLDPKPTKSANYTHSTFLLKDFIFQLTKNEINTFERVHHHINTLLRLLISQEFDTIRTKKSLFMCTSNNSVVDACITLEEIKNRNYRREYVCLHQFLYELIVSFDTIFFLGGIKALQKLETSRSLNLLSELDHSQTDTQLDSIAHLATANQYKRTADALTRIFGSSIKLSTQFLTHFVPYTLANSDSFITESESNSDDEIHSQPEQVSLSSLKHIEDSQLYKYDVVPSHVFNDQDLKFVSKCSSRGVSAISHNFEYLNIIKPYLQILDLALAEFTPALRNTEFYNDQLSLLSKYTHFMVSSSPQETLDSQLDRKPSLHSLEIDPAQQLNTPPTPLSSAVKCISSLPSSHSSTAHDPIDSFFNHRLIGFAEKKKLSVEQLESLYLELSEEISNAKREQSEKNFPDLFTTLNNLIEKKSSITTAQSFKKLDLNTPHHINL
ncbi:putative AAA domain-containing protein [Smittium mucronatum]|uniref:Putative AAA domain-containing protein n=1 Tax=Smittium mucronatum TaxID=133383 RepID=A0A1R0GN92_9FUNG|nr:putative AAA domain-containing protein [Smittium mucronatum]